MLALLANAKLILGALASFVFGTLYIIFMARGKEISVLNDEIEQLKQEEEVNNHIRVVTEETSELYSSVETSIEELHDLKVKELYKTSDKPLTPSFLAKLRNIDGLQDKANRSSK